MSRGASSNPDGRLRIVHCFRSPVGGIFRHVRDLVRAQTAAGHQVGIVCDSATGGAREEQLFSEIAPVLALGLQRIPMQRQITPTDIITLTRLFRRIGKLDPDVIHTHGAKGGVYGRAIGTFLRVSGKRVARIYCPHGGSLHYDARTNAGRLFFGLERLMERMTDGFVFVSRYECDAFAAKVGPPEKPFCIAPNGIEAAEFAPLPVDSGRADFLYIGMMRDLKGPDLFIDALALIRDRRGFTPSALMVGDGPDTARYKAKATALGLGGIVFHPAMPARRAFAMAERIVVPSRAESMPYIVLEGVAAGLPMVATEVGGIPEIFGALAPRLVPPGAPHLLAAAMEAQLDDPARARADAEALRASIRDRFSIETMARSVEALYAKALEGT
ncbi:MAG TPA: glycosyltransferase family 4 protein [Kaistia sp.]|nr:glycosyltransferase family 4 protein [Kaistia sp.]